jgi:hypothetical protein
MWKVSTGSGSEASHTATAGPSSTSRSPPTTVFATQPITRSGPALMRTVSKAASAEGACCREATTTASETSAPPICDRATSTAASAAVAASGSVESAAPIFIPSTRRQR